MLIVLLFLVALSVAFMFILSAFGVLYFEDGIKLNDDLFDDFISSWYGWVILILLQVAITSLLCFVPGASMAFILLIQAFFPKAWQAFILAYSGVVLSSLIMYVIGKIGGYKICEKLLGTEDCQKASDLLNHKGAVYFPLMMMFPIFPDDALVMIAGTLKMSMKWFAPSILFGRGIGVATIIFGLSVVPYEKFTTPIHWIGFILTCAIMVCAIFYAAHKFNVFLEKHAQKKHEHEIEDFAKAEMLYEKYTQELFDGENASDLSELKAIESDAEESDAEDTAKEGEKEESPAEEAVETVDIAEEVTLKEAPAEETAPTEEASAEETAPAEETANATV